jgi:hypothetical protein
MAVVFEVELNGQRFANAGHEALGVLSAHVTASGKLGRESQGVRHQGEDFEVALHVGGLTSLPDRQRDQHLRWGPRQRLVKGDEIRIRVRNSAAFDQPTDSYPAKRYGGSNNAISERRKFRQAREVYTHLIFKYGTKREVAAFRARRAAYLRGTLPR